MGTVTRGKVQRGDQAQWDGKTATVTRVDATGGTITGYVVDDHVDVLHVFGGGATLTVGTINAALQFVGATVKANLLFGPGTWVIDSDVTIPANLSNRIAAGCVFAVSTGKTLTFSGPVYVEHNTWFSGAGTVSHTLGAQGFPGY